MVVAVERALQARRARRRLRVDRQHGRVGAATYAARAGLEAVVVTAGRRDGDCEARAGGRRRGARRSRSAEASTMRSRLAFELCAARRLRARQLREPRRQSHRGPEDRSPRDRRAVRRRARRDRASLRRRRQRERRTRAGCEEAGSVAAALVVGQAANRATTWASAIRIAEPAHSEGRACLSPSGRRAGGDARRGRAAPLVEQALDRGGGLLRAGVRGRGRGAGEARRRRGRTAVAIVTGHGLKDTEPSTSPRPRPSRRPSTRSSRCSDDHPRARTRVDREPRPRLRRRRRCARPLERGCRRRGGRGAGRRDRGRRRGRARRRCRASDVRAFALVALADRFSSVSSNRIPLERGLGSSAAAIAIGLVAGAAASGRDDLAGRAARTRRTSSRATPTTLPRRCSAEFAVTWEHNGARRVAQIASDLPLTPVIAVARSSGRIRRSSRNGLPQTVSHDDAGGERRTRGSARRRARLGRCEPARATRSTTACTSSTASTTHRSSRDAARPACRPALPA